MLKLYNVMVSSFISLVVPNARIHAFYARGGNMTCSNDRKITFLLQKKDSKATERWQGSEGYEKGKWELRHGWGRYASLGNGPSFYNAGR